MDNIYLLKEVKKNYDCHEVFSNQTLEDMERLFNYFNVYQNCCDVVIDINSFDISSDMLYGKNFDEISGVWERFIDIKIMKAISKKLGVLSFHNLFLEEELFSYKAAAMYNKLEKYLITKDEIIELMKKSGMTLVRLHIIANGYQNTPLYRVLARYMEEDVPFVTMIYTNDDFFARYSVKEKIQFIVNDKYKIFDRKRLISCDKGIVRKKNKNNKT